MRIWANLYNAATLKIVVDRYPVKSIRDIKSDTGLFDVKGYIGPWRTKVATVEGRQVSLDDIEHEIMRPTFKDPRVHYAVNCASIGCPNLLRAHGGPKRSTSIWTRPHAPSSIIPVESWYARTAHCRFPASTNGTRRTLAERTLASSTHLRRHAGPELSAKLAAGARGFDDEYDWTLNQVGGRV